MLNLALGAAQQVDGRTCIVTGGKAGHAVYGPYEMLEPGRYVVTFHLSPAGTPPGRQDSLCAVLDVAADIGQTILATKRILQSQFADGRDAFTVEFSLPRASRVEYRVWVSGHVPLVVEEHCRAVPVPTGAEDVHALAAEALFPHADEHAPAFFRENLAMFRGLYEQGMRVALSADGVVLTVGGVSLYVRSRDDLTFVGEVFHQHAYNLKAGRPVAVIDVGMNIGLTSLMLAGKPEVAAIHAFEPFANTFDRAMDNLRLNPTLAAKIVAHPFGLSDKDWDGTLAVASGGDSGSRSTITVPGGQPVHLVLKDAGRTLRPLVERAETDGLAVVVKLDCEGSEFPILRSLDEAGLIGRIDAFMVEWHAMFPEHTQETLLAPLRAHGFLVFDQSPPTGNGFFYAVRMAAGGADRRG